MHPDYSPGHDPLRYLHLFWGETGNPCLHLQFHLEDFLAKTAQMMWLPYHGCQLGEEVHQQWQPCYNTVWAEGNVLSCLQYPQGQVAAHSSAQTDVDWTREQQQTASPTQQAVQACIIRLTKINRTGSGSCQMRDLCIAHCWLNLGCSLLGRRLLS